MSSEMGEENNISNDLEAVGADPDTFGEMKLMEIDSNDSCILNMTISDMLQESMPKVDNSVSFNFEPECISMESSVLAESQSLRPQSQSSMLVDSQSLMPQLQPFVAPRYSLERAGIACSKPRSMQLTGKRKSPPESTVSGFAVPNKQVEPVHHRPWLHQFVASFDMPSDTFFLKTEHEPVKKVRQMEPGAQKSGKQAMNKKQKGPPQNGDESLRCKMKESLAAALALVQECEESPEAKNNSEASVPVTESNEPASACGIGVPVAEGVKPELSTKDETSEQKDDNGGILLQEASNDTEMNYVNQSDVQKTQFDDVFPCHDGPFSDSIFSSDELLQGNGLSWALEPVSDLGENGTGGEKSFEDPDLLASNIEFELYKLFGGANKKYKEKGRSLLFNLKDKNNPELRESVMSGKISPEKLCSMTAEELASKELSQWRQAKAEEMAEMVVLRDADVDVRLLVRKTHKGEYQVEEIDPVDSGIVDLSAEITSRSRPRSKAKTPKSAVKNNDSGKNTKSDSDMTLPSTEEIDPMQGLSMDDELKDVGDLPPIVSLDEFMESLNSEPPFGSPQQENALKEEATASEKSDTKVGSDSKSPMQSPKEPSENGSPKSKLEKTNVTSPKLEAGVELDGDVSKPENPPLVDSMKEDRIWDGIMQLSSSSVVSVTGIFKSGEKAKTSEWPTLVEVKGRVRLSAFGKFVKELPLSRSRVIMVMNVVCKDGISQSQRDSLSEVAKSYVADQRVGYAEPTSGVELYLCPPRGETLDLLSKVISKDHLDEVKSLDNNELIGVVVWRRAVASPASRHKPGSKSQHSSNKSSVLARENKKPSGVNVTKQPPVVAVAASMGKQAEEDNEDDVPPGFGPVTAKDDDDLPEFNFNSSSGRVVSPRPPPPPPSRSVDQVRELILKYGNSAGANTKQPWNGPHDDDDDDDDIPEWQPEASSHQILPPPPPLNSRTELDPRLHSRTMARPLTQRSSPGQPARQQQYSGRRSRGY